MVVEQSGVSGRPSGTPAELLERWIFDFAAIAIVRAYGPLEWGHWRSKLSTLVQSSSQPCRYPNAGRA